MVERRLMTADHDTVQISHEALLRAWPRLAGWVAQERESLRLHQQLAESADYWAENTEDPGALLRGARLTAVQDWAAGRDDLTPAESAFLDASLAAAQEELATERRRSRRLRRLAGALVVLLVVAVGAGGSAYVAARSARHQTAIAQSQRYAAQSAQIGLTDPRQGKLLALRGWGETHTTESLSALLSGQMMEHAGVLPTSTTQLKVALSPDGRWTATGGDEGSIRLWDNRTHEMSRDLGKLPDAIWQVGFSPDGTLVSAGSSTEVRIWKVGTGELVRTIPATFFTVWTSNTTVALMTPQKNSFRVGTWDVLSGRLLRQYLTLPPDQIAGEIAVSPDLSRLAVARRDGVVDVLDLRTGQRVIRMPAPKPKPRGLPRLSFSADGDLAVGFGDTGAVTLWDGRTGRAQATLNGADVGIGAVASLVFSNSGRALMVAGGAEAWLWDVRNRVWTASTFIGRANVRGTGAIMGLATSKDANLVAATGQRSTMLIRWNTEWVRPSRTGLGGIAADRDGEGFSVGDDGGSVWRVARAGAIAQEVVRVKGQILSVAQGPDGTIAASSTAGDVIVLDRDGNRRAALSVGDGRRVPEVAFPADGSLLAAASQENITTIDSPKSAAKIRIWDARTFEPVATLSYAGQYSITLVPSARGDDVAVLLGALEAGRATSQILLYRGSDLARPDARPYRRIDLPLNGNEGAMAFSPDSRTLAVAGGDGRIKLFDTGSGVLRKTFAAHPSTVRSLIFSPDGNSLATVTTEDSTVRLWDARDGTLRANLTGHDGHLNQVAFSMDGQTLYSTGTDGTIGVWNLDPDRAVTAICSDLSGPYADEAWRAVDLDLAHSPCVDQ